MYKPQIDELFSLFSRLLQEISMSHVEGRKRLYGYHIFNLVARSLRFKSSILYYNLFFLETYLRKQDLKLSELSSAHLKRLVLIV
jgi:hypothetical protein